MKVQDIWTLIKRVNYGRHTPTTFFELKAETRCRSRSSNSSKTNCLKIGWKSFRRVKWSKALHSKFNSGFFKLKMLVPSAKQHLARTVFGWETAWELLVLLVLVRTLMLLGDEWTVFNPGMPVAGGSAFAMLVSVSRKRVS